MTASTCVDIDGYGCCRACGKRVECGRCRNPYDEGKDALGVCAECLAEAFNGPCPGRCVNGWTVPDDEAVTVTRCRACNDRSADVR